MNADVHPHGHTRGYEAWPDDVRDQIIRWDRDRALSFYWHRTPTFECEVCRGTWVSNPNGDAHVRFGSVVLHFCDDCLVRAARPADSTPGALE